MAVEEAIGEATLHDETLAELGLNTQPYSDHKKSNRFADSTAQKIRAEMEKNLRFGESLHLFIGEKGVGKTVFLSQLIKHCKTSIKPFVARGEESFEAEAFLAAVLHQLDSSVGEMEGISDHVDALMPHFETLADDKVSVVLAIDDAHLAPIEEIAELIDIMGAFCKDNGDKTARLLLTGEPKLKDELSAIADELDDDQSFEHTTTVLPSLDENRVREYLATQLHQAGHTDAFPFTDKAVTKLHRESKGVPGKINSLAAKYLNTVYSGAAAPVGGKGFFTALGWPLLALGAAAVGLIAWGLSMFFGNSAPEQTVVNTPVIIEPVAETVTATTNDSGITQDATTTTAAIVTPEVISTTTAVPEVVAESATITDNAQLDDGLLKPADRITVEPETVTPEQPAVQEVIEDVVREAGTDNELPNLAEADSGLTEQIIAVEPATNVSGQLADNPAATTGQLITEAPAPATVTTPAQRAEPVTVPDSVAVSVPEQPPSATTTPAVADTDAASVSATADGIGVAIDELKNIEVSTDVQNTGASTSATSPDTSNNGIPVEVATAVEPAINRAIENERWVLFQAPEKFTVQLATSRERSYIIDLAQTLAAEDPVAIYPFRTTNSQNPVFGLLSGLYETRSDAIAAVDRMASDTKQFGVWIRPIGDLQAEIKKQ